LRTLIHEQARHLPEWRVLARTVPNSFRNRKLGKVASTYASQASCPDECPLLDAGCYASYNMLSRFTRSLNTAAIEEEAGPLEVARAEAEAIDLLPGTLPLRLHVVGDCASKETAEIIAAAAERYQARGGQPVWTYTHSWRSIPRSAWGAISVLASCETPDEVRQAARRGYAAALIVAEHPSEQLYEDAGIEIIPCAFESRGVTCADCLLCAREEFLRSSGRVIGFSAHGGGRRRVLEVIDRKQAAGAAELPAVSKPQAAAAVARDSGRSVRASGRGVTSRAIRSVDAPAESA
jgi:hypothetical protein